MTSRKGRRNRSSRIGLGVVGAIAAALLLPAAAFATTAEINGAIVDVAAGNGEANGINVDKTGSNFFITDTSAPINGGGGIDSLNGGPGNDTIDAQQGANTGFGTEVLFGNDGNDTLTGSSTPTISSDLDGGPGNDDLEGGAGSDFMVGETGADVFHGNSGSFAQVTYGEKVNPVTVTIDDVANDGEAGEGDNVHSDINAVTGGSASDTITGSDRGESLSGSSGDDTLNGGGGDDTLGGDSNQD